jgi:hypothetical protein
LTHFIVGFGFVIAESFITLPIQRMMVAIIKVLALTKLGAKKKAEKLLECTFILITLRSIGETLPISEAASAELFHQ